MTANMKSLLTALCVLAVIYKTQANTEYLECWQCSSNTSKAENFCGEEFSERNIPTDLLEEHHISIVRSCNSTINSEHERPVCRKTIDEVDGKHITKRFCYYTNKGDPLDHCQKEDTDKNVKRLFCEDCLTNKCNSASQLIGMSFMLIIPIVLVKKYIA